MKTQNSIFLLIKSHERLIKITLKSGLQVYNFKKDSLIIRDTQNIEQKLI